MAEKTYLNNVGVELIVDTFQDLLTAGFVRLKVRKPDGTEVTWNGTIEADTNGEYRYIKYVTGVSDLNQVGVYELQSYIQLGDYQGTGQTTKFMIFSPYT